MTVCLNTLILTSIPLRSLLSDPGPNIFLLSVTLSSGDVLVEVNWSDWEARRKEIKSKIKVDIIASLEEVRDAAENEILKELLSETDQYKTLRLVIKMLYERFYAVVYKVMGGCIELWIANETLQQAYHLQDRRLQVEEFLSGILIRGQKHVRLSVSVMLDFVHGTDKSTNNLPRYAKLKRRFMPQTIMLLMMTRVQLRKIHKNYVLSYIYDQFIKWLYPLSSFALYCSATVLVLALEVMGLL